MRFDDLVRVSFRQVFRQRRRSLGVALAISLGTAALIIIITMGQDIKGNLNEDLELLGGATRIKAYFDTSQEKYSVARPQWFRENTTEALGHIPGVTGVTVATFRVGIQLYTRYNKQFRLRLLAGVDEYFWEINSFSPALGKFFGHEEIERREKVCVLGGFLARKIFGKADAIGGLLYLENDYYRVIGILDGLGLGDLDEWAFIPYTTAMDRISGEWLPDTVYIRCRTWDDVKRVAESIPGVILANQPAKGIKVEVRWEYLERVKRMAWWIEFFVYLAIAATMILGGFGIWNIMMAGVQARTREIGLKKAIGAEGRDILTQFLAEALCLSLSAALIGTVIGRSVIEVMSSILDCHPPEDLFLLCVGLSLLFSVILGIGAGIVPSIRASRMEVVHAVRFE